MTSLRQLFGLLRIPRPYRERITSGYAVRFAHPNPYGLRIPAKRYANNKLTELGGGYWRPPPGFEPGHQDPQSCTISWMSVRCQATLRRPLPLLMFLLRCELWLYEWLCWVFQVSFSLCLVFREGEVLYSYVVI